MKIGAITIGQSPRADVAPEFLRAFGGEVDLVQCGALDGLSLEQVRKLAPEAGDYILVTRMRDGTEVKIAERHIHERMKLCVRELEKQKAEVIVLFCTGEFPDVDSSLLILKPDRILAHTIPGVIEKGRLGVVMPAADQIPVLGKKWNGLGLETAFAAASPYSGTEADFRRAAEELRAAKVDLIVLDCIGFTEKIKAIFREAAGVPVVLPRTLLGRVAAELGGSSRGY